MNFRGATGYRPLGWAGPQPDSISTADHNLNAKSEFLEGNLSTPSLSLSLSELLKHILSSNPGQIGCIILGIEVFNTERLNLHRVMTTGVVLYPSLDSDSLL